MNTSFSLAKLSSAILVDVSGKDSERYLNNRLSNNIKSLIVGEGGIYAAALSVQGKCEALFFVCRTGKESYLLLADGGQADNLISVLSRYKVADKVTFEIKKGFSVQHVFLENGKDASLEDLKSVLELFSHNNAIAYSRKRFGPLGFDVICPDENELNLDEKRDGLSIRVLSEEAQFSLRAQAGIPQFPIEIGPDFLLQESTLEGCYSITKGCYIGQEVIQKIASFANAPTKLFAFQCTGQVEVDITTSLEPSAGVKIGEVLSKAYDPVVDLSYGFIRVKMKYVSKEGLPQGYVVGEEVKFSTVTDFSS